MTLSLLAATAVHGAVFGVAAIVLSHGPAPDVVPIPVEVEVVAPRPEPIADRVSASVTAAPSPKPDSAPGKPRIARRSREMAFVSNSTPSPPLAEPSAVADAPAVSRAAPSLPPASAPATGVRASAPTAPSGDGALSAEPRYRTKPKPDYPIPSQRRREEGTVLVNVQVLADGAPAEVSLNRSCGYPPLDRAALDAVRRSTFEPERVAGVPVSSRHVIRLRFSLDDR